MTFPVGGLVQFKYWMGGLPIWRVAEIKAIVESTYIVKVDEEILTADEEELRQVPSGSYRQTIFSFQHKLDDHKHIYLGSSHDKGRGVFAKSRIPRGTEILSNPVIVLTPEEFDILSVTSLAHHIFRWPFNFEGEDAEYYCLAFGLASMINHSSKSNVAGKELQKDLLIAVHAIADIETDEEILMNYELDEDEMRFHDIKP